MLNYMLLTVVVNGHNCVASVSVTDDNPTQHAGSICAARCVRRRMCVCVCVCVCKRCLRNQRAQLQRRRTAPYVAVRCGTAPYVAWTGFNNEKCSYYMRSYLRGSGVTCSHQSTRISPKGHYSLINLINVRWRHCRRNIENCVHNAPAKHCSIDPASTWLVKRLLQLLLADTLAKICNASFREGSFPEALKLAIVRPRLKNRHWILTTSLDSDRFRTWAFV